MFKKILIANRGENVRVAPVSAQPHGLVRAAHASDLVPMEATHV
jgi:acetyl/propionyl-CoA carboxylase alpha subunit